MNLRSLKSRVDRFGRLKMAKLLGISYHSLTCHLNGYSAGIPEELAQKINAHLSSKSQGGDSGKKRRVPATSDIGKVSG